MESVLRRWPSALGLTAAVLLLVFLAERETVAISVGVAALCYLAPAALGRRWVAWATLVGGSLVVVASDLLNVPWWAGMGAVAVVLVVVGVVLRVPRPVLTAQTVALAGYGGAAVAALFVAPRLGLVLVGLALAAHAAWDLVHFRRDQVVPRSYAEACLLFDVPLGLGVVVLALGQ